MPPIVASGTDFFDKRYSKPPVFVVPSLGAHKKASISWRLPKTNETLYVAPMKQIDQAVQRDMTMKQKPCAKMLDLLAMRPPKIKAKYMGIKPPSGAFRHEGNGIMTLDIHNTQFSIQKAPDLFHHVISSRIPIPN